VGEVKSVNDNSPQALFEIDNNGKEILIPINDEFIKNINRETKTISVLTPPGLIDLFVD
jgi:16S rRNA processing protein RimM